MQARPSLHFLRMYIKKRSIIVKIENTKSIIQSRLHNLDTIGTQGRTVPSYRDCSVYYRMFISILGLFSHLMSVALFVLVIITRCPGMHKRALKNKGNRDHLRIIEINEFNYFR